MTSRTGIKFKSFILRSLGYIPQNVFAVWDFKAGLISEREMWRIINKNIGFSKTAAVGFDYKWRKYPRRGDKVILNYTTTGVIDDVHWEDGSPDLVYVAYDDGEYEEYEYDDFKGRRVTIGGPNQWYIEY